MPDEHASLVERWSAAAAAHATRVALCSDGSRYTFAEADHLSDVVAARLLEQRDDRADPTVALHIDHDAEALIGLLGILKAGRVVVVLDPHLPMDRLRGIVALASTPVCLTDGPNRRTADALGNGIETVLDLDQLVAEAIARGDDERPTGPTRGPVRSGAQAASIVFTSGSTGRPKGVLQTHGQMLADVHTNGTDWRLSPEDRVASVLPYGFAAGFSMLLVALLHGASVWSFDPRDGGTRGLVSWIRDHELTTLTCTPHLLRSIVAALPPVAVLESLRMVCTLGEAIHGRDVVAIRKHLAPTASYFQSSGSSEVGTLACLEIPADAPVPDAILAVGRPVVGKDVHLLADDGSEVPEGESGELVVVSDYLSGGYWRDDASNATRFGTWSDGRRTCRQGDLARFDEHGLRLLGRADAAIKVRGYLVEPSEIESALLTQPGVLDAVVVPVLQPPAPTRLVAYVVPDPSERTQSPAALRRGLRERLPEYMVPGTVVTLTELPRNDRGKIDRLALPEPVQPPPSNPPSTQWEIVVADLWGEVLGLDFIGLDDDFMALGGDSLSAEEMLQSVQERLGVALTSSDLVEEPTLRGFVRRVTLGSAILPVHPDVVPLQSGQGLPVFCFAGSGALALSMLPLSRHFSDRPVYGMQAHGLERRAFPDLSVEASSRRFLEMIRVLQPHGPYVFIGHSFGGLVALEIADRLTAAGEQVELVVLVDTYLPRSAGQQPTFEYGTLATRPPLSLSRLGRRYREVQQRMLPEGIPALRQWARHARSFGAGVIPYAGQRQFDAFFDQSNRIMRRYQVRPYAGRALLVLGEGNPDGAEAWSHILVGPHRFVDVPAEHSSLLREPYATTLAGILRPELEGVRT